VLTSPPPTNLPEKRTVWVLTIGGGPDGAKMRVGFSSKALLERWKERNIQQGASWQDTDGSTHPTIWVCGDPYEWVFPEEITMFDLQV